MKFLDANVFLFAAFDKKERGRRAKSVLAAISPANPAATTVLVLNEVIWNLRKTIGRAQALAIGQRAALVPGLRVLPLRDREWQGALDLMATHVHLKPHDALHAASAIAAGLRIIVSSDADFDGLPGLERENF